MSGAARKQQSVTDDRRAFPARRQSSYPPSLCSIRKIVCHESLVRLKVTSQDYYLVYAVVTPMHRSRPSVLKQRAVRLPNGAAVVAIDAEKVGVFTLMGRILQFTDDNR